MFSGQNILVIGALSILTLLIISFYSSEGNKVSMTLDNEAVIAATGLGQTIIEKLTATHFDEKVIDNYYEIPDSLTSPLDLRPDSGETDVTMFDDFDDYNNYSRTDTLIRLGEFHISVVVNYVNKENADSAVNEQTFYKMATVSVSNSYLFSTLKLHYLASY
jgi:hypothetical protein